MSRLSRGDTIIELVLAFAIFSIAAVSTIVILNTGITTTQRSLEITLVRQQIDSQAEMLRYIHDSGNSLWPTLIKHANLVTSPKPISAGSTSCQAPGNKAFFVFPASDAGTFTRTAIPAASYSNSPDTYAQIHYDGNATKSQGIWIQVAQAQNDSGNGVNAYDFYIHGCWMSTGSSVPVTLGTIVRIYEN